MLFHFRHCSILGFVSLGISRSYSQEKLGAAFFHAERVLRCILRKEIPKFQASDFFMRKWMLLAESVDFRPGRERSVFPAHAHHGQESPRAKPTQAKTAPKPRRRPRPPFLGQ